MCHDAQTVYGIQLAFLPSTDNAPHLNELSALRNTFCTRKERILCSTYIGFQQTSFHPHSTILILSSPFCHPHFSIRIFPQQQRKANDDVQYLVFLFGNERCHCMFSLCTFLEPLVLNRSRQLRSSLVKYKFIFY